MNKRFNVYDDNKYKDKVFEQYDKVDDGVENKANKCPKQEPSTTLITGNSIMRDITKKTYNLEFAPICIRGMVISHITAQLLKLPINTSL